MLPALIYQECISIIHLHDILCFNVKHDNFHRIIIDEQEIMMLVYV